MQTQPIARASLNGDRVREHTAPSVIERIDRMTNADLDAAVAGGPEAILRQLPDCVILPAGELPVR